MKKEFQFGDIAKVNGNFPDKTRYIALVDICNGGIFGGFFLTKGSAFRSYRCGDYSSGFVGNAFDKIGKCILLYIIMKDE